MENKETKNQKSIRSELDCVVICHCCVCGKTEKKKPLQEGFTQGQLKLYKEYCDDCIDRIAMETLGSIIKELDR